MSILRFRRDRRHADSFAATPVTHYAAPRFADPHGVATDETLAGLRAQAEAETEAIWYGWDITAPDNPPPHDRPYVPGVLGGSGRLSPATASVEADLGSCILFRDTVSAVCVRAEPRHGCGTTWPPQAGTWQERYGAIYRHRTKSVAWPDFSFATSLRALEAVLHAEAEEAEMAYASRYLAETRAA